MSEECALRRRCSSHESEGMGRDARRTGSTAGRIGCKREGKVVFRGKAMAVGRKRKDTEGNGEGQKGMGKDRRERRQTTMEEGVKGAKGGSNDDGERTEGGMESLWKRRWRSKTECVEDVGTGEASGKI